MGYGMIAKIGNLLVEALCRDLVPDAVLHNSDIGLCSPDDHGNLSLGIYLYDISENEDIRTSGMVNEGVDKQSYPPVYLSLYYMITAYSGSDMTFRAPEEHKILGRVIQALRDNSILSTAQMGGGTMPAQIQLQRMSQAEKIRMWNFAGEPYKLSLFYRIQPVEIPSARTREITRVKDAGFAMKEDGKSDGHAIGRRAFHASLVVLVIDDFTGEPALDGKVTVLIPGHRPPVVKSDGYHVFVNLSEDKVEVLCESKIYEPKKEQVELTGRSEDEVFIIRLVPSAGYPVPSDAACVSGQTQPGRKLMFWKAFGDNYRLLYDYVSREQEEDNLLAIYNPHNKEIEGKAFFICDKKKKEKEYFKVISKTDQYCRIDRALRGDYKKIRTSIVPVSEICADETGRFFLPVQGNRNRKIELFCRAEGEEEKRFLLQPGRVNTITL